MIRLFPYNAAYGREKNRFDGQKSSGTEAGNQAAFKAGVDIEAVERGIESTAAAGGDGHV